MELKPTGPWAETMAALRRLQAMLPAAIARGMEQEADFFKQQVVDGIKRQSPGGQRLRPLAMSTRFARAAAGHGGLRALLRSGELVAAIEGRKMQGQIFVGVPASARGSDGRSLLMVARIAEFGSKQIEIPITPQMRRFLFATLGGRVSSRPSSRGVIRFRIAPRPIFGPVMSRFGKEDAAQARMSKRVAGGLPRIFR